MSDIKLTKAQREWLASVGRRADGHKLCVVTFPPHVQLCALGLMARDDMGIVCDSTYSTITPAGRAWLAAHPRRK